MVTQPPFAAAEGSNRYGDPCPMSTASYNFAGSRHAGERDAHVGMRAVFPIDPKIKSVTRLSGRKIDVDRTGLTDHRTRRQNAADNPKDLVVDAAGQRFLARAVDPERSEYGRFCLMGCVSLMAEDVPVIGLNSADLQSAMQCGVVIGK